jgi:hypothetical protein
LGVRRIEWAHPPPEARHSEPDERDGASAELFNMFARASRSRSDGNQEGERHAERDGNAD